MPKGVYRNLSRVIGNTAILTCPTGHQFEVNLVRRRNVIWLAGEKFNTFATHYSLRKNEMVWFTYKGNNEFDIVIFEESGVEIDYAERARSIANATTQLGERD